jgi:hypothetical protein
MANSSTDSTLIHLQKLSVGSESIESLADWQRRLKVRREQEGLAAYPDHITRMTPKRRDLLLNSGSIYWVIKGIIQCRNRVIDLQTTLTHDGRKACRIVLDPELVPVVPMPRRAFQGWRYLSAEDAPQDLAGLGDAADLPANLRAKLVDLGAW